MAVSQQLMTVAEFEQFIQQPENRDRAFELISGIPVEMPPSSRKNTILGARMISLIGPFVEEHDLGYMSGADGGYQLGLHDTRQPDAAFIRKARVTDLEGIAFDGAPDLAIEVISPSESPRDVLDKTKAYLKAGGQQVWNLYPSAQVVDVCSLAANGEDLLIKTVDIHGTLDGGDLLPGFTLSVRRIFP
jgi:Uma2 family endonuclease